MKALDGSRAFSVSASTDVAVTNVLLIVNPGSRSGRRSLAAVQLALRAAGVACQTALTTGPRHATSLVVERIQASDVPFDAVLTLGGDGTAMEVATGLSGISHAPPLGVLAAGTLNALARSVGIPMSPVSAVSALLDADVVAVDLGQVVGGPAFAIGLGIGLDAAMIGGASSVLKRRIGFFAYAWSALRAGLRLERFHARVSVDGVVHDVETSSVLVANFGRVLGDMICFGEDIAHQDGLLDVCVYSPRSVVDAGRILARMLFGGVSDDRCVRIIRGRHIRIETDPPRPMQADGELLGVTPVEITVDAGAVRMLVPRARSRRWRFRRLATARVGSERLEHCVQ